MAMCMAAARPKRSPAPPTRPAPPGRTPGGLDARSCGRRATLRWAMPRSWMQAGATCATITPSPGRSPKRSLLTTPQAIAQFVQGYADAGCDELILFPTVPDLAQLAQLADVLARNQEPGI